MVVLTGATGLVGSALLRRLLAQGEQVRVLVRDPRRLGPDRVRVQITLGDLSNPVALRQLVRGASAVVHLAATIRDQPAGSIEELNGLATARLLRHAETAGVERFVFFGAIGATPSSRTRFFRAKALAERAVMDSPLDATVLSPSIVYAPGDRWITLLRRMSLLPVMPILGQRRGVLPADLGRGRRGLRAPGAARGRAGRGATARAGRPGDPHLRGDRPARPLGVGPGAAARAPAAMDGEAQPAAARADVRPIRVRHVGGGGADGGADGRRGRHAGRPQPRGGAQAMAEVLGLARGYVTAVAAASAT